VLSLTNQPDGKRRVENWVNGRLGIVPYIMPGFALAKLAAEVFEKDNRVEGLILLKHGIFTFGETAKESYDRMIHWVSSAEKLLNEAKAFAFSFLSDLPKASSLADIAKAANILRGRVHRVRSAARHEDPVERLIVRHRSSPEILRFVNSREAAIFSQRGPLTPDHIIRTKAIPLLIPSVGQDWDSYSIAVGKSVDRFQEAYGTYFERQTEGRNLSKKSLDPLPRVALAPGLGLFAMAADAKSEDVALDIYEHTIDVIEKASRIGIYEALPENDLFDMEYWSLEQAKLGAAKEKIFSRKVVWISGAASGIGLAVARAFAAAGAHIFLTDLEETSLLRAQESLGKGPQLAWTTCDVTNPVQVRKTFEACSIAFGGVDVVVSNAGQAPTGDMASCPEDVLRKSFEINFFSHQTVSQAAVKIFRRQGLGGDLLFNASKSAFNPGPGFGPYSVPKAGVIALMRQYAVELGKIGVRVNAVNADRVNTNLYAGGLLEERAKARGVPLKEYLSGNLLSEEVYAEDVAQAFLSLAQARKTTGAVFPVDGGNPAAFPR
jgi:rhamnose utilization protein RhaD (predicted bifunctional aldolase and dehydrogenase)/NAD(P)-dependent dehydrogenase (short-subunit alcohol dehydrogenase family)